MIITKTEKGVKKEFKPFFDIMHRIFRHTLFPRIGNLDMVHGHLVDMLLLCHSEKGTDAVLDVSHVMWKELVNATYGDHCPIYAPFIFKLIQTTWSSTFPGVPLETGPLTSHDVLNLRQKELWASTTRPEAAVSSASGEDQGDDGDLAPGTKHSSGQSGWVAKLKHKVKKLFCLQTDVQHKMYLAHVDAKKARQERKAIMRKLEIPVQDGSEDRITPEDKWISSHSHWTDSDESNAATSAPAQDQEIEEETEESKEESVDGSDSEESDESMGGD
mgnify:FL=1